MKKSSTKSQKTVDILIVEDDMALVTALEESICNMQERLYAKPNISSALSCEESLRKIHAHKFDIILLDLWLPDGHGTHVHEEIINSDRNQKTPVIFLSGNLDDDQPSLATEKLLYMEKPFQPKRLEFNMKLMLSSAR